MERSLTRRGNYPGLPCGTPTGGVAPDRRGALGNSPDSGSETAFLVKYGKPYARAAQRRPGAEHRARPGLPELASLTEGKRLRCTPGADRRQGATILASGAA